MPLRCPVRPLADMALSELANTLVTTIGHALADNDDITTAITIVTVQTHLEDHGATAVVYQDLLRLILGIDRLTAAVRFTSLQALLNASVHSLVSEIFPFPYYEKILQVIAAQGSGLRSLNLKGVWVKDEHMPYMYDIVRNCAQLRRLCIPYVATDELLEHIAKSAGRLCHLDISGETDITDIGIETLCRSAAVQTLRIVDIGTLGEESVCHTDIAELIVHLPQLESLVTYSYVGRALGHVRDQRRLVDAGGFRTRLRYVHDTRTSERTMAAIVEMCPRLESLYLDTPDSGVIGQLARLPMQRLKVHKFCCREFEELLAVPAVAETLRHLTLMKGRGRLDVGRVARWCLGLVDLDLYMMERLVFAGDRKFECLRGLEMLSSPLATEALRCLVCSAPRLQRLAVDRVEFGDQAMNGIFLANEFRDLEDVWFTTAPNLTVDTVEMLMDQCPMLQSIGQLSGWSLTPDDIALLRGILESSNSSLTFTARYQDLMRTTSDDGYWM